MAWTDTLKTLAPTVATALGGPLAGAAISAIGSIFGLSTPTADKVAKALEGASLTPEDVGKLRALEMQYTAEEAERGFKYEDLVFQDRKSARESNVAGGTQKYLFILSVGLLAISLGSEVFVLFKGYPASVPDIVVGRVLGYLDAVGLMVLTYWYGATNTSGHAPAPALMGGK